MHVLHADSLGPLPITSDGYKHVLVLINGFTKYFVLQPLKTVKADETKLALQTFISLFGTPKCILMEWSSELWNIQLVLNTTIHKATQTSPLKALLGIEGATPLIQNLLKNFM